MKCFWGFVGDAEHGPRALSLHGLCNYVESLELKKNQGVCVGLDVICSRHLVLFNSTPSCHGVSVCPTPRLVTNSVLWSPFFVRRYNFRVFSLFSLELLLAWAKIVDINSEMKTASHFFFSSPCQMKERCALILPPWRKGHIFLERYVTRYWALQWVCGNKYSLLLPECMLVLMYPSLQTKSRGSLIWEPIDWMKLYWSPLQKRGHCSSSIKQGN